MLRFALFGAGRAGTIHAENITHHPQAELFYLFDINHDAARRLADQYGGQVAENPDRIWTTDEVDAVLIASSTNTHIDLLRGAMQADKATYCEKPIDLDINKVKAVAREARHSNIPILIGFRRRYLSAFQMIRQKVQNGDVGTIESVHLISRDFKPPSLDYINVSGGFLRDKMIHYFDLIPWLMGERPTEVYATGSCLVDPAIGKAGDVDTAMVILRMPSGALCHIANGRRSAYGYDERLEVFGSHGILQSAPPYGSQITHFSTSGIVQDRYLDLYGQESFAATLDAFITAVKVGSPVEPSLIDGVQAQLIAEAAVESLQTNRPVTISYWQPD